MTSDLILPHLRGDTSLLYGEHTTEATAFIGTFGLEDSNAIHQLKKILDLVEFRNIAFSGRGKAEFPHSVTAVVKTNLMGEFSR